METLNRILNSGDDPDGTITSVNDPVNPKPWPDPTPEMLNDSTFEAIWQCIKTWDMNVPEVYGGYCGATGNHVRAILDAIKVKP